MLRTWMQMLASLSNPQRGSVKGHSSYLTQWTHDSHEDKRESNPTNWNRKKWTDTWLHYALPRPHTLPQPDLLPKIPPAVHHEEAGDTGTQKRFWNHLWCSTEQSIDMEAQKMLETSTDTPRQKLGDAETRKKLETTMGALPRKSWDTETPQRLEICHNRKMEEEGKQETPKDHKWQKGGRKNPHQAPHALPVQWYALKWYAFEMPSNIWLFLFS